MAGEAAIEYNSKITFATILVIPHPFTLRDTFVRFLALRDENRWSEAERALSAQVGRLNPRLSTEYTDTWQGSRGRVRCIWTGSANPIIYSSMFDFSRLEPLFPRNDTSYTRMSWRRKSADVRCLDTR